jgi:hypothetical protein
MGGYFKLKLGYYLHALGKKSRVAHAGRSDSVDGHAGIRLRPYNAIQRAPRLL